MSRRNYHAVTEFKLWGETNYHVEVELINSMIRMVSMIRIKNLIQDRIYDAE